MSSRWRIFFTTAAAVLALDQLTKLWIVKNLTLTSEIPVIPGFFSIVSVRNRGAAFGFLNRSDIDWQFWLFLAAPLVAAWAIIMLVRKSGRAPLLWTGLALVMGGAIGNLVDRIRMREVVDFLDFYFRDAHWPAFNIADVGIFHANHCDDVASRNLLLFFFTKGIKGEYLLDDGVVSSPIILDHEHLLVFRHRAREQAPHSDTTNEA